MLTKILAELYTRDLDRLKTEIELFRDEADLWKTTGEITNSAGNLCLHICGNLQHFVGSVLGDTGYIRDRDAEFASRDFSRGELISQIDHTSKIVKATLGKLSSDDLARNYPLKVFDHPMTTEYFLVHLTTHLNYHLGQINYHRRLTART
ncbi:MAG: DUF1572 domain-containing protein [Acidobacteria bacterium]|nr:DUF1572 domain-containing protein [Acidobacteriota bacterium]